MNPHPDIPAIGQIGRPAAFFMIEASYPTNELEEMLRRAMMGEKIEVQIASTSVYVFRHHEFDTWWLIRNEQEVHDAIATDIIRHHHPNSQPPDR